MGDRLGIIAGSGDFPFLAAAEARRLGREVVVAAVRGEADPRLADLGPAVEWFDVDDPAGLTAFLIGHGIRNVLLAGKVRPEAILRSVGGGLVADRIRKEAAGGSPAPLIAALIRFLEGRGIRVEDPTPFLGPLFCPAGPLTKSQEAPGISEEVAYGFRIARTLADADIGQTVVVKGRMTVSVEGIEGTDRAILRGGELGGPGTVVVKVGRSNQDPRIDLPAVGLETVRSLVAARAAALAIEAGRIPFFGKEEAVALAEGHGISLLAVRDPASPRAIRSQS
jgi:UDP-2,3-diacylglucosamine hydrolase